MYNRRWTDEEIDYLMTNYGIKNYKVMAKALNRTPYAVAEKAYELKMGVPYENSEQITSSILADAVNVNKKTTIYWIKKMGLKATYKTVSHKRKFYFINLDEFWKWAEKNRRSIRWNTVEKNILGKEPLWVDEQRKIDTYKPKDHHFQWTTKEDKLLKMYYTDTKKTIPEIAKLLNRTTPAVNKRIIFLKIKRRTNQKKYTEEDVKKIIELKRKGYTDREVAEKLGRSYGSLVFKRKELCRNGMLDWKYEGRKKKSCSSLQA